MAADCVLYDIFLGANTSSQAETGVEGGKGPSRDSLPLFPFQKTGVGSREQRMKPGSCFHKKPGNLADAVRSLSRGSKHGKTRKTAKDQTFIVLVTSLV